MGVQKNRRPILAPGLTQDAPCLHLEVGAGGPTTDLSGSLTKINFGTATERVSGGGFSWDSIEDEFVVGKDLKRPLRYDLRMEFTADVAAEVLTFYLFINNALQIQSVTRVTTTAGTDAVQIFSLLDVAQSDTVSLRCSTDGTSVTLTQGSTRIVAHPV